MVINARSLRNKLLDFQAVVYTREIDIVIVSETWLDNTVSDYEILPNGYSIFPKDCISIRQNFIIRYSVVKPGLRYNVVGIQISDQGLERI